MAKKNYFIVIDSVLYARKLINIPSIVAVAFSLPPTIIVAEKIYNLQALLQQMEILSICMLE